MDHIRQRDWCSTRSHNEEFIDEQDIEHCVIEKIIRNKFWDPLISSDEDEPVGIIDWESIFKKKNAKEHKFRRFVPGYRVLPLHPKLSALTQDEHRQFIKVLSAKNRSILPAEFVGRPSKADSRVFEEKQGIYAAEQKEYIEWAKHLWITTNCIRALRPKPLIEMVYEAEFKMKTHMMQFFPKTYKLAAQIPLQSDNQTYEVILPKKDLIQVDITSLPEVYYPDIYESKASILQACAVPEPCAQHPCKFKLPNESAESLLPLTEIHKELAQYALENNAGCVASENAVKCLLETDRSWCLPVSVCEVILADGDKSRIVVLGSEFPMKKEPAPVRSYRAFRHLLLKAFTSKCSRSRTSTAGSEHSISSTRTWNLRPRTSTVKNAVDTDTQNVPSSTERTLLRTRASTDSLKAAKTYTNTLRKIAVEMEANDDSDEEDRLEIDLDEGSQNSGVFEFLAENKTHKATPNNTNGDGRNSTNQDSIQARRILKPRTRRSINQQDGYNNNLNSNHENDHNGSHENNHNGRHENNHNGSHENNHNGRHENNHNGRHENNHNGSHENNHNDHDNDMMDSHVNNDEENLENNPEEHLGLFNCVCKESELDLPKPRSFKNWQIKNNKTKEQVNVIIHSSHKLKNNMSNEVILEPIVEYQLDIGGTALSTHKLQSLAFSLMLRKNADLATVRVDGMGGEVVTIDVDNLKSFTAERGEYRTRVADTIHTAASQLAGLLPGAYLLLHEPAHGANAMLYARAAPGAGGALTLDPSEALPTAEEARLVQAAPRLAPVLLPYHKYRRQLPLAFTYDQHLVAKESNKPALKKKTPPAAIHWPKKKRGRNKRRQAAS